MRDELGRSPSLIVVNRFAGQDASGALEASEHDGGIARRPRGRGFAELLKARSAVATDALEAVNEAKGVDAGKVVAIREAPAILLVGDVLRWLDTGALA